MKILAIGAHPDDIEIFMYGLVSIYKKEGNQIFTMIATDGSKGGSTKDDLLSKKREKEIMARRFSYFKESKNVEKIEEDNTKLFYDENVLIHLKYFWGHLIDLK